MSRVRKFDLTAAEHRLATDSCAQPTEALAARTAARAISVAWRLEMPAPSMKAELIAVASSQA
jgi:hypothetical protein